MILARATRATVAAALACGCSATPAAAPVDAPIVRLVPRPAPLDVRLDGQVLDDRGFPVPDVTVRDTLGDTTRDTVTDGGGRFHFAALAVGRHALTAQARVDGAPSGVIQPRAIAAVDVPSRAAHDVQLVVRRTGAIAWSRPGQPAPRPVVARASARGAP